jgi:hypothetical protein
MHMHRNSVPQLVACVSLCDALVEPAAPGTVLQRCACRSTLFAQQGCTVSDRIHTFQHNVGNAFLHFWQWVLDIHDGY